MKNLKINNRSKVIILIITMLLLTYTATAQDRDYKFSVALITDPNATYKDGFNLGASVDYQMQYMYFKVQVFAFPELNDVSYTEISGTPLGFNYHSKFNTYRLYTGLKLGFIYRQGTHPLAGLEGGIDFSITPTMLIGLMATYETREDFKIYGKNADTSPRASGFIKLGFRF